MVNNAEIFLKNMFIYFKKIVEDHIGFDYLHYPIEEGSLGLIASFLEDMQYLSYEIKTAKITTTTKSGQVYDLKELSEFNKKYFEDIQIIGVGNEIMSINHDAGGAVIKFQVNISKYADEINLIKSATKLMHKKDIN